MTITENEQSQNDPLQTDDAPTLTLSGCQKIIGATASGWLRFCGLAAPLGESYCSEHRALIFQRWPQRDTLKWETREGRRHPWQTPPGVVESETA